MLWRIRALLDDRPGAMAALATSCGRQNVNILGLQIFPAADGRVVDELVLHTPGGWSAGEVEQLCRLAGVEGPAIAEASPHALEDQPVRYMRAAQVVMAHPERFREQLCRLLDASPADGIPGVEPLVLEDPYGPPVRLTRAVPFTDTEIARASELRRLAAVAAGAEGDPSPLVPPDPSGRAVVRPPEQNTAALHALTEECRTQAAPEAVVSRPGTAADASALMDMHARCSAQTIYRRYHAPLARVSARLARALLEPVGGVSMVMAVGKEIIAIGMVAEGPAGPELGLMVEDRWQRQGLGTRLLHALAVEAADRGFTSVTCMVQAENTAVLATIHRAHLRAHVALVDGVAEYRIPVDKLADFPRKQHNRPAEGDVTTPLVPELHGRRALRETYPPADF